jgi:hypothetical protein
MKPNHLKSYSIGNYILNKSFVSTSKTRSTAQLFADNRQGNVSNAIEIPVLLRYAIKQNETAINIEHLSMIPDEEEILILPFSIFKVKNRIENSSDTSSTMLVEIDLEECEDNQQIDYEKQKSKLDQQNTGWPISQVTKYFFDFYLIDHRLGFIFIPHILSDIS